MPKGHRRTQSSNLVLSTSDSFTPPPPPEPMSNGHEIVSLLAKSSESVGEKVSNVEVLHSQSMPENSFFNFGKQGVRNSECGRSRHLEEEYMMGVYSEAETTRIPQEYENNYMSCNPFGKKQKSGIGVTQVQPRFQRMPFVSTVNYPVLSKKGSDVKEMGVKKENKGRKKEERRRQ